MMGSLKEERVSYSRPFTYTGTGDIKNYTGKAQTASHTSTPQGTGGAVTGATGTTIRGSKCLSTLP